MNPSTEKRVLHVGDKAILTKTFTEQDVVTFSEISGDKNPVHLDESFASQTRFGRRIVHGMLVAGVISAVLGTELPGPGSIYLSQTLKFRTPVYIGDRITAYVEITALREDKPIATLTTICRNEAKEAVIEGEAVLLLL